MLNLKLKHSAFVISTTAVIVVCSYLLLTLPTSYPSEWNQVKEGIERGKANAILSPLSWQKENSAYMLEYRSSLRLWRIDVNFTHDKVSQIKIYHEDPHDTLIKEIRYIWSYL
jgi:hypothetical protein